MPDRLKKLEDLCPQREDQLRDEIEQENFVIWSKRQRVILF